VGHRGQVWGRVCVAVVVFGIVFGAGAIAPASALGAQRNPSAPQTASPPVAPRPPTATVPQGGPLATSRFATNLLLGLSASSLKANGDEPGWLRTQADDGNDGTHWSGLPGQGSVANSWWAADLAWPKTAVGYRKATISAE
jgi:hypothetical protein